MRWLTWMILLTAVTACGSGDGAGPNPRNHRDGAAMASGPDAGERRVEDMTAVDDVGADDANAPPRDMGSPDRGDVGPTPADMRSEPDSGPPPPRTPIRASWPRGHDWVRNNAMFVSGLTVELDGVNEAFVDAYYDDFGANAIHLWELGVPDRLADWLAAPRPDHRWLSWLRKDGRTWTNEMVAGGMAPGAPGRIGYQIGDEPRTWEDFTTMMAGAATVRAHDPDALVFLNMSYHATELDQMMADQCGADVDIISYDDYSMRQSTYERLEYFRDWGLQCDKPYWRYIASYYDDGFAAPEPTDMRWQALVGLVYGYTGHSWFLYQIAPMRGLQPALFQQAGNVGAARRPAFDVAASLNRELLNYGRVITRLTSTDVRYISALGGIAQPPGTTDWQVGAGQDPYLVGVDVQGATLQDGLVGFFVDNFGERYVMLQNPHHGSGSFPVGTTATDATFTLTFDFSSARATLDRGRVEHYDGVSGSVADATLVGDSLQVTLAAGDVYLFKYASGAPWDLNDNL